jgi:DNA-binding CsgD family transcriptional regulator
LYDEKRSSVSGGGLIEKLLNLRLLSPSRLGWAFLLAWVFCMFYTGVITGCSGDVYALKFSGNPWVELYFTALPMTLSILMLICIVGVEKRAGAPVNHPAFFWIAPVATALSTPLFFCVCDDSVLTTIFFTVGAALTGFGSGLMWVMWGEFYARVKQDDVETLVPISVVIAALLVLLMSAVKGWVAVALATTFPLLSGLCLYLSWKGFENNPQRHSGQNEVLRNAFFEGPDQKSNNFRATLKAMGRVKAGLFFACLTTGIAGCFWWLSPAKNLPVTQIAIVASIIFLLGVSVYSVMGPRRITVSFLYRWMCPTLVIGFVAMMVMPQSTGVYCAYGLSLAVRFAFCLITQMFFASYAAAGKATPVQAFGFGWAFVHLGDLAAVLLLAFRGTDAAAIHFSNVELAGASIVLLVVVTMFVLNDETAFSIKMEKAGVEAEIQDGVAQNRIGTNFDVSGSDELNLRINQLAKAYGLTTRETEIFSLLARGRSIPYIRDALFISRETAATHAKRIYQKLGVHSRQELIDSVD